MQAFALAMELPIILVVAPAIGFFLGQWLDGKFHTSFLALLIGLAGFLAGVREVLRRIPKDDAPSDKDGESPGGQTHGGE